MATKQWECKESRPVGGGKDDGLDITKSVVVIVVGVELLV